MTDNLTPEAVAEPTCLISQAKGRAAFLRDRGEVKTPDMLEALAAKLAEVEADNADLRLNMDADLTTMCRERDALQAAEAEIARLRDALTFYRNGFERKTKRSKTGLVLSVEYVPTETLLNDCGNRAIDALDFAALQPKDTDHE